MSCGQLESKLMDIVTETLEIEKSEMEALRDVNVFETLEVDSLLALEIVARIEKEFKIKIQDEQIETLVTFNKMFDLVKKYIQPLKAA